MVSRPALVDGDGDNNDDAVAGTVRMERQRLCAAACTGFAPVVGGAFQVPLCF